MKRKLQVDVRMVDEPARSTSLRFCFIAAISHRYGAISGYRGVWPLDSDLSARTLVYFPRATFARLLRCISWDLWMYSLSEGTIAEVCNCAEGVIDIAGKQPEQPRPPRSHVEHCTFQPFNTVVQLSVVQPAASTPSTTGPGC